MSDLAQRLPELTRGAMDLAERARVQRAEYTDLPEYYNVRVTEWLLLVAKLAQQPGLRFGRVLELGCGHGLNLVLWRMLADDVVGIDLPDEIERSKSFLSAHGCEGVSTVPTRAEDLTGVEGTFDLIVSQYVLEHVDDVEAVLASCKGRLCPGGTVLHILNNAVDRLDWFVMYRDEVPPARRLLAAIRDRGLLGTLRKPVYTPPHEPKFGDFTAEHAGYRREAWAQRIISSGWVVVDHFQTRDVNCVLITQPLDS